MITITTQKNHITSLTLLHLEGWIESIGHLVDTEDWPFDSIEELALQLEVWRNEFTRINPPHCLPKEDIKVMYYGEETILICKEETGEFIKLTLSACTPNPVRS